MKEYKNITRREFLLDSIESYHTRLREVGAIEYYKFINCLKNEIEELGVLKVPVNTMSVDQLELLQTATINAFFSYYL